MNTIETGEVVLADPGAPARLAQMQAPGDLVFSQHQGQAHSPDKIRKRLTELRGIA